MKFIFSLIISFFSIFPSYAYDEKIKLNRATVDSDSKTETIKVNLNELLDLREIKKASKRIAAIQNYTQGTSRKVFKKGERKKYKGAAVNVYKNNAAAVVYIGNQKENGMGTGSIINKNGESFTNLRHHDYCINNRAMLDATLRQRTCQHKSTHITTSLRSCCVHSAIHSLTCRHRVPLKKELDPSVGLHRQLRLLRQRRSLVNTRTV